MRLGLYTDIVYRSDGQTISTDRAFIRFVTSMPPRIDELVLFGRFAPAPGRDPYAIPNERVRVVALPHYPSVFNVPSLVRAVPGSVRRFAAELDSLDAVWIFGPNPVALALAQVARRRRKPVALGVRQDYPQYIGNRLPNRAWSWALPAAHALERGFRLLARTMPTVVLGEELARNYSAGPAPVFVTGFSLIRDDELSSLEQALGRSWHGDERRVITVGRLDPEKNPLLLVDVIAALRERDSRWRLAIVGDGPMRAAVEARIRELGVEDAVELLGYVPNGPGLWERYRSSHVFLHVSFTEGLPQVLFEAQAAGLPIVATDVGGVRAALGGGEAGLLIPPADRDAAVGALERLAEDEALRRQLIEAGLENAARETMDAQIDRILDFLRRELGVG